MSVLGLIFFLSFASAFLVVSALATGIALVPALILTGVVVSVSSAIGWWRATRG